MRTTADASNQQLASPVALNWRQCSNKSFSEPSYQGLQEQALQGPQQPRNTNWSSLHRRDTETSDTDSRPNLHGQVLDRLTPTLSPKPRPLVQLSRRAP